ncbi:hypothetical protein RWH45_03270 [Microbacterium sp. KSW4-17]|uniref:Uncharacterized protein n=1 Tax=Microbacterium galbum TaxID=3075994 RepID=A0ABU3T4H1_9MICO|nr:hypothetical protein [Microbacterium sp. KSW4-17]MDU0366221.1 hypothetical protein [Microbacterium sp. KSW4-17]
MDPLTSLVFVVVMAAVALSAVYGVVREAVRDELTARGRESRDSPASDA